MVIVKNLDGVGKFQCPVCGRCSRLACTQRNEMEISCAFLEYKEHGMMPHECKYFEQRKYKSVNKIK